MVGQPTTFWRSETFGEQDRSAAIRPSGIVFYRLADAGALRRLVGEIRELKPLKLSDM